MKICHFALAALAGIGATACRQAPSQAVIEAGAVVADFATTESVDAPAAVSDTVADVAAPVDVPLAVDASPVAAPADATVP